MGDMDDYEKEALKALIEFNKQANLLITNFGKFKTRIFESTQSLEKTKEVQAGLTKRQRSEDRVKKEAIKLKLESLDITKKTLKVRLDEVTARKDIAKILSQDRKDRIIDNRIRAKERIDFETVRQEGVKRNILLRKSMMNTSQAFNFVTNSITKGRGILPTLGLLGKGAFDSAVAFKKKEEAEKAYKDAKSKGGVSKNVLKALKKTKIQTKKDFEDKTAGSKHLQAISKKLANAGTFFSKHAGGILIGAGAVGVLLGVIKKALSASPLFQQMMKLMKFMVTLILMPIGTFFGALLRPILILLLRKLIIPMFSKWMPIMMKWGTKLGEEVTKFLDNPVVYIFGKPDGNPTEDNPSGYSTLGERFLALLGLITENVDLSDSPLETEPAEAAESEEPVSADYDAKDTYDWAEDVIDNQNNKNTDSTSNDAKDIYDWAQIVADHHNIKTSPNGNGEIVPIDGSVGITGGENSSFSDHYNDQNYNNEGDPWWLKELERTFKNPDMIAMEKTMAEQAENWKTKTGQFADKMKIATTEVVDSTKAYRGLTFVIENAKVSTQEDRDDDKGVLPHGTHTPEGQAIIDEYNKYRNNTSKEVINPYGNYSNPDFGLANGGVINEPISGIGLRSGSSYALGESGAEVVTPINKTGGTNITINIQNMNGSNDDMRKLKQTILDVIQESSNNRGRI